MAVDFDIRTCLLNPQQREAAVHIEGPMLVLAGAGSGKTRTITHRIAHMLSIGIPPDRLVAVSFTNKAAAEMRTRVAELVGPTAARRAQLSTFHALGADILRRDIKQLGYRTPFSILDISDQKMVVRGILKEHRLASDKIDPQNILNLISKAKMAFCEPAQLPGMRFHPMRPIIGRVFEAYRDQLKILNAIDFDDMIAMPVQIFTRFPDVLRRYHDTWHYFMVDEYQDTNYSQFRLLNLLSKSRNNVVVVGDDDQSIYGFRGANSEHILNFEKHFPGAKVVLLEQNYRSTQTILEAANAVIACNTKRREKALWSDGHKGQPLQHVVCRDEQEEAAFVAEHLERMRLLHNAHYRDFAVLYRSNMQSRATEEAFRNRGIPLRIIGGTRFYDRTEVRDLLHYLKACLNPANELSMRRIVNRPRRGIAQATLSKIDALATRRSVTFFHALRLASEIPGIRPSTQGKIEHLVHLIQRFHDALKAGAMPAHQLLRSLIAEIQYIEYLQSGRGDDRVIRRRVENVKELVNSVANFEKRNPEGNLEAFLDRVALEPSDTLADEDEDDVVTLMTFHGSKGLEFPYVFMVGCEEGLLPHKISLDEVDGLSEERRLCYVGITRAKKILTLTGCAHRMQFGESTPVLHSRFLDEIPDSVIIRPHDARNESSEKLKELQKQRDRKHLAALRAAIFKD